MLATGTTIPAAPSNFHLVKYNASNYVASSLVNVRFAWDAVAGVDGYIAYSGFETGNYTRWSQTTDTSLSVYFNPGEATGLFLSVKSIKNGILSDYATEIEAVMVQILPPVGYGLVDYWTLQAVEKGVAQSITATPATNQRLTAYKIGSSWTDWPSSNDISLGTVTTSLSVTPVFQPIPTEKY